MYSVRTKLNIPQWETEHSFVGKAILESKPGYWSTSFDISNGQWMTIQRAHWFPTVVGILRGDMTENPCGKIPGSLNPTTLHCLSLAVGNSRVDAVAIPGVNLEYDWNEVL